MSDQAPASGTQHSAPQPRVASTAELQVAAHQLAQQVQSHLGSSTPAPSPR